MKKIIDLLEAKWKLFEEDKYYCKQCDTSGGRKDSYLNILFKPVANCELQYIEDSLECELHPGLKEFYESCNGIMLFSESLRIYGVGTENVVLYNSYDIVEQNEYDNVQYYSKDFMNFVVFGYYSSCLFCFDTTNFEYLYVVDIVQEKIVYKFTSIEELLMHYVDYLINEYDGNGKKIHYDKDLEGLPIANVSLEFI